MKISLYSPEECERIAKEASLKYVTDAKPGITRKKIGKKFVYFNPDGSKVVDERDLNRIKALAIPPAYHHVWICPSPNGHIQATGKDVKNRKQYRYHSLWRKARQTQKFHNLIHFGRSIFSIREHVNEELSQPPTLHKTQVMCAILYLLDTSCIRIGNTIYAKENGTYGLTTLRKKHLSLNTSKASLDFEGKNSKTWHIDLKDKKIVKILRKCEEIPGYELFKYLDETNTVNVITSQEINAYLQALTNHPLTAKDFRTWIASREIFTRLIELTVPKDASDVEIKNLVKDVAELLGHTPAICQKNYIYPEIISFWQEGKLETWCRRHLEEINTLNDDELFLLWLEKNGKAG